MMIKTSKILMRHSTLKKESTSILALEDQDD